MKLLDFFTRSLQLPIRRMNRSVATILLAMAIVPALVYAAESTALPASAFSNASRPTSVTNDALLSAIAQSPKGAKSFESFLREQTRRFVATLTAREALTAMEEGLLTSSEYVDILIERIESYPEINAFIHLDIEGARAAAEEADKLRSDGEIMGPLHGLPIVLKDSINTADMPTTAGTPALANFQPSANAPVVQALVDAGAIILGKTNLHELSDGFTTKNAFTGPTGNPYDINFISGGSSGGNGAALAARFAPLALGEDTAGSVRVPAALTGTMGFRPTTGRYPAEGVVPLSTSLDTVGPMGRDVRDLALADAVITGDAIGLEPVAVADLRIGVPEAWFRQNLDFSVEWAFARALRRIERAGATLVPADIPDVGPAEIGGSTFDAFGAIFFFEVPRALPEFLQEYDTGVSFDQLVDMIASPDVAAEFEQNLANPVPEAAYQQATNQLVPFLKSTYMDYLEANDLDVVVYPTTPIPALPIDTNFLETPEGTPLRLGLVYFQNTHFTPVIGAPTLTLPLGQRKDNLPAGGIDIAGRPGDDRRILAIGHAISQILPRVRPPMDIRPRPFPL